MTTLKSNFELVKEFQDKFSIPTVALDSIQTRELRWNLISEETHEVFTELFPEYENNPNSPIKSKVAKELADLLYVVYGTAATFDIDIDTVFKQIHVSNMSKLGNDDKPLYRKDGKITKGPNYQPPDLSWLDNE